MIQILTKTTVRIIGGKVNEQKKSARTHEQADTLDFSVSSTKE